MRKTWMKWGWLRNILQDSPLHCIRVKKYPIVFWPGWPCSLASARIRLAAADWLLTETFFQPGPSIWQLNDSSNEWVKDSLKEDFSKWSQCGFQSVLIIEPETAHLCSWGFFPLVFAWTVNQSHVWHKKCVCLLYRWQISMLVNSWNLSGWPSLNLFVLKALQSSSRALSW